MAMAKSVSAMDLFSFNPLVKCPLPDLVDKSAAREIADRLKKQYKLPAKQTEYDTAYTAAVRAIAPCVYFKPISESDGTDYGNIVRDSTRVTERSQIQLRMVLKYTCNERGERLFADTDEDKLHALPSTVFYDMVNVLIGTLARIPTDDIDSDPTGVVQADDSSIE